MKKFSTKVALLFAVAMALSALAVPAMSSAAGWTAVGSEHTLDSTNFGFTSTTVFGTIVSQCTSSSFTSIVATATNLEITSAAFGGDCTALINQGAGNLTCTLDWAGTKLPWTATAISTSSIQIHGVHLDLTYTQSSVGNCPAALVGLAFTITGTISTGGSYDNTGRTLTLNNAEGLTSHNPVLGSAAFTLRGTFRDTAQTLTVD